MDLYNVYSKYLKNKYGQKVYKLPVNLPVSCPNRDDKMSGGCAFCGIDGAGFESLPSNRPVSWQLKSNMDYIGKKYKAKLFIAYFQNFSNTYLPLSDFKKFILEATIPNIVEISISTRPDCINEEYLIFLDSIKKTYNIEITIELGLQTPNYHTLAAINRGHSLAEFIDAVMAIHRHGFDICTHLILNLPWDNTDDAIEAAKIISALNVQQVKLHSLYILKDSLMGKMFERKEISIISVQQYMDRVVAFLEYLSVDVVVQRLVSRAPWEKTLFLNWHTNWWIIKEGIEEKMRQMNTYQGKKCDYLNGKAVKKFLTE